MLEDTLVIVLAGGVGERLYPLTKDRAKRPDVRSLVDGQAARLLGAHVGRRAEDQPFTRVVPASAR